jgi:hypothetical protein
MSAAPLSGSPLMLWPHQARKCYALALLSVAYGGDLRFLQIRRWPPLFKGWIRAGRHHAIAQKKGGQ